MAYVKQNWVPGEVITADKMLHIEDGIVNATNDAESGQINIDNLSTALDELEKSVSDNRTDIDDLLKTQIEVFNARDGKINLDTRLDEMMELIDYEPIKIKSFTVDEMLEPSNSGGNFVVRWTVNQDPAVTRVNNQIVDNSIRSLAVTYEAPSKTNTDGWRNVPSLLVFDAGVAGRSGKNDSAITEACFYSRVYYGAAADQASITSNFIKTLGYWQAVDSRVVNGLIVNAESNKYIWYASPVRLGRCIFPVNGLSGGFEDKGVVNITNLRGFSEDYYVYRSVNHSLGNTILSIY